MYGPNYPAFRLRRRRKNGLIRPEAEPLRIGFCQKFEMDRWRNIPISNNVGGVKQFASTLLYALVEERHFALVEGLRFSNLGSL